MVLAFRALLPKDFWDFSAAHSQLDRVLVLGDFGQFQATDPVASDGACPGDASTGHSVRVAGAGIAWWRGRGGRRPVNSIH